METTSENNQGLINDFACEGASGIFAFIYSEQNYVPASHSINQIYPIAGIVMLISSNWIFNWNTYSKNTVIIEVVTQY